MYDSIRPGQEWLDTNGAPIQAHGGSVFYENDWFYWYGENKERTVPGAKIWHWGVRMYRSQDLYNWEDLGLVLPPVEDDPEHPLHPRQAMDRPHIIRCPSTGRYVMWIKVMGINKQQIRVVACADALTGPYAVVNICNPLDMSCGDFDLVVDSDDGKAYHYFERVHSELIVADLTTDCCDHTGYYSTHMPEPYPPFVREAPAYFKRHRKHYLFTSGTTGYYPNRSQVHWAWSHHGPWTLLGDPHPGDREHSSYRSQITSVLKHPSKPDLYIALADRWLVDLPETLPDIDAAFAEVFKDQAYGCSEPDWSRLQEISKLTAEDTSRATYVWLPIRFDGDMPLLDWHDEWRIEDY